MCVGLFCDLVFCDIEMFCMDGFELLFWMKKDLNLEFLFVVMLIFCGVKKYMEMVFELGVKGYFIKLYIEDKLLDGVVNIFEGKMVGDIVNV